MNKLIVTVTCDSTMSYPSNPNNPTPRGLEAVAAEYVRGVNAGIRDAASAKMIMAAVRLRAAFFQIPPFLRFIPNTFNTP